MWVLPAEILKAGDSGVHHTLTVRMVQVQQAPAWKGGSLPDIRNPSRFIH